MIAYILLTILVILITLLFIPLQFYARGRITADIHLEWGLMWAGGLVSVRWNLPASADEESVMRLGPWVTSRPTGANKSTEAAPKPPKKPRGRTNWRAARAFLDKQAWKEVLAFLARLWRSMRLRCDLEGDYSTDDPALTAYIAALITLINQNGQKCHLHPRFADIGVNLNGTIQGQLRPGLIIWDTGRFIIKRPIRKIWWTLLREGKKQR